ncbi:hypothetical protein SAMN05216355_10435 [Actinomyces ruminicola]|uniref:Uncharacterized protein n=1 Tax=Actinomyces ruminicola TaxID=332524 RepID=A0A1H0BGH9_9ACTO|nr:hypothetical protein [Actinomyces ruminicola]SDN44731.1 hypothetical protein SAMN05216355_10435 [Actinomyces ruminicola]
MATWAEIRAWSPDGLAETTDSLLTMSSRLLSLHGDAELALTQVASQSQGVNAIRAELRSSVAEHGEAPERVGSLHAASYEGLLAVRRKVLECQDYADSNPHLSLAADGTVTAILPTSSNTKGAAATAATSASAAGANADAKLIQSQADELAAMVAATVTLANQVDADYAHALKSATPNPQPGPSPTPDPNPNPRTNPSHRGGDSATRSSRSGRVVPRDSVPSGQGNSDGSTSKTGLGDPVPGEHADMPGVDPWQYPGDTPEEGSGPHGQREPTLRDHLVHEAATVAARALEDTWPDAAANLNHYLDNTGTPQYINVDGMLNDLSSLDESSQIEVSRAVNAAVDDYKASGATGPMTYPFNTDWTSGYAQKSESENWFYETGGYHYCTEGTVTVYPPTDSNSDYTYSYDYRVHVADRYNWDYNKETPIGPATITDAEMQKLHQAGIAQEYDLVGKSSVQHGTGP